MVHTWSFVLSRNHIDPLFVLKSCFLQIAATTFQYNAPAKSSGRCGICHSFWQAMSVVLFHHFVSTILVKYVILVFASPPLAWKLRKVLDIAWSFSVKIFQALIWFSSHLVNAWKFKFPLWRKEIYSRFTLYCDSELVQQSQNLSTAVNDIANWPKSDSNSKLFMSSKYFFLSINKWHMVPSFQNI